ncbi:MAG: thiamine-phosphate kinase [Methyloceanibacter sp.]
MINGVERAKHDRLGEFDIIARYFAPLARNPAALGLLDDAAVLAVPEGQELVVTTDTIIEGVHFLAGDPPDSIGHKALAVNLSDLAAKGARPVAYLLNLTLPEPPSAGWLENFALGLRALQEEAGIDLVGGDTSSTPGPLTISITALGLVPQGEALLRRGAVAGDRICVSGTIGDAALGLKVLRDPRLASRWGLSDEEGAFLTERYRRPSARGALALPLRRCGRAAIDVSDGLVGDLQKLCRASGVGATIEATRVPLSAAAAKAVATTPELLAELLTAGDDYEILGTMKAAHCQPFEAEAQQQKVKLSTIGAIHPGDGEVAVLAEGGAPLELGRKGFTHF